jgi:ribosomal-protein-alanine N-acetyltransferase
MLNKSENNPDEIIGNSLILKPFNESNITPKYLKWLNDPDLMKYSNQRFKKHDVFSSKHYLNSFMNTDNLFYAIYFEEIFIGTITAYISKNHKTADMGILIGNEMQGKGFGLDAWNTLMGHLTNLKIRKISGGALRPNLAMIKIMMNSGMTPDGMRLAHELFEGVPEDILHFSKFV